MRSCARKVERGFGYETLVLGGFSRRKIRDWWKTVSVGAARTGQQH